jgi:hypothetical protein
MAVRRVAATQQWLSSIVLANRLCPFAPPVRAPPQLRISSADSSEPDDLVTAVAKEAALLQQGIKRRRETGSAAAELPETTLLVLPREAAPEWMDLVRLSWRLQSEAILTAGHGQDIQLVLFHPLAVHSMYGEGPPDAADYSIRSPYPTVHLLREMDVLAAVNSHPDASQIPGVNKARLRSLGLAACETQLLQCDPPPASCT